MPPPVTVAPGIPVARLSEFRAKAVAAAMALGASAELAERIADSMVRQWNRAD